LDAYDIFVSYSHQDRERVRTLVNALSAEGWRVFWDRTIPAGESWRSYIGAPLAAAPIVVVCWTKVSVESDWVSQEADAAAKRRVLLPVMFDEVTPPLGLGHIHAADLMQWVAGGGGKLPADLKHAIVRKLPAAGATAPAAAEPVRSPPSAAAAPAQPAAPRSNWRLYGIVGGAATAVLALVVAGFFLLPGRPAERAATGTGISTPQTIPGARIIATERQAETRDASGKLTREAAVINFVACDGGVKPDLYVYDYFNRKGFRAIQPPNWGEALGGRDFASLNEAIAAGCGVLGAALGPSHDGYALRGGDILRYYGSPSEGACRADCEREGAACRAYTWVKPGGYKAGEPSVCYLMTSFRNPVRHACCVTATRGPFPER
jgi:hypothetical protein